MPVFCLYYSARHTILQSAVLRLHVVRACVHTSVMLVDQDLIGCKPWKLIAQTILAQHFALRSPQAIYLLPGEYGESLRRLEVNHWGKWCAGAQKRQYL